VLRNRWNPHFGGSAIDKEHSERHQALLEHLSDPVLVLGPDGAILWSNPAGQRHGLRAQGERGHTLLAHLHPDDKARVTQAVSRATTTPGKPVTVPALRLLGSRNCAGPFEATLTHLPDTHGIRGLLLTLHESLARAGQQTGNGRRESEELLRQVVQLSNIGIFDHDHTTDQVYWSPEQREIYGVDQSEPLVFFTPPSPTSHTWELIHPEDRDRVAAAVRRAHAEEDGLFDVEYRIVRHDGSERWVATRSQTFFDGEGSQRRPARTIGAVHDITERRRADRERQLMYFAIDTTRTPFYAITSDGKIAYANEHAGRSLGVDREELIGRHVWELDPDFTQEEQRQHWRRLKHAGMLRFESRHRRMDGSFFPVEITTNYFSFKGEEFGLTFAQDITERKRHEQALRESEDRLRQAAMVYDIGVFDHDLVTGSIYWSPELRRYWQVDSQSPPPLDVLLAAIHPEDRERVDAAVRAAHDATGDGRYRAVHRIVRNDSVRWLDSRAQTFFEGHGGARRAVRTVGAMVDVTSRVAAEETLRDSLHEKETLLREVHHRVKNNLQIIASLLHFQAKKVRDPSDLAAFTEGRDRLRSMILVHEKLYQSRDLSRIDLGGYLQALVRELQRSNSSGGQRFEVRVTADKLLLPIESALPCGMIVCELLTNAFKYAFPEDQNGEADVSVAAKEDQVVLSVSDSGVGLPAGFDPEHTSSFGWQLVRNLTTQLGGTVTIDSRSGTHVTIAFTSEQPAE
jgi:PAS domain S-box-containing protein